MFFFLGCVLVVMSLVVLLRAYPKPRIVTAHVINMEESKQRLFEFQENARDAQVMVERWPAYDSRSMTEEELTSLKLSKYIWKYAKENKKMGMMGCYLSHRELLKHLQTLSVDPNDAHLILEDDAYIPSDFWTQWDEVQAQAPKNWDMLQLGVTFPNLTQVNGRIHRHLADRGNGGTFAYVVRHRALPKINRHLEYMSDPIDIMFRNKWREWNYYVVWPEICPHNDHGVSIIVEK